MQNRLGEREEKKVLVGTGGGVELVCNCSPWNLRYKYQRLCSSLPLTENVHRRNQRRAAGQCPAKPYLF